MRDRVRIACVCFAAIFIAFTDWVTVRRYVVSASFPGDWTVLWPAGRAADAYADPLFAYPPTALLWLKPIAQLPFAPSLILWSLLGTAALYLAGSRLAGKQAALAMLFPAWVVAAMSGQMSLFVGAFSIFGLLSRNPWVSGLCFTLAGTLKPQALIALPLILIASREWRTIGTTAVCSAALVLLTMALWGVQPWLDWVSAIPRFRRVLAEMGLDRIGVGLNGYAVRLGIPAIYWAGIAIGVAAALTKQESPLYRYVVLVCASALISPYTLHYDLAGLGIALAAILFDRDRPVIAWLGAALAVSFVLAPVGIVLLALGRCSLDRVGHAVNVIASHGRSHTFGGLGARS